MASRIVVLTVDFTEKDVRRFQKYLRRDEVTGCLLWTGGWLSPSLHYGRIKIAGKMVLAHRCSWLLSGRVIPPETPFVLHNCPTGDNPACCEVSHLFLGTHDANALDRANKNGARRSARGYPRGVQPQKNGTFEACIYSRKMKGQRGTRFHLGYSGSVDSAADVADAARELRVLLPHLFVSKL